MTFEMNRRRTSLRVEALENRVVPTVYLYNGELTISGTSSADSAIVTREYSDGVLVYKVAEVGSTSRVAVVSVTANLVVFYGYGGADYFENATPGLRTTAFGGEGNDVLLGGALNDTLTGGNGYDVLHGRGGNDILHGGFGGLDDSGNALYGGDGNDTLYGGVKNDVLYGQNGSDTLWGRAGNDWLFGGTGRDYLHGEAGDDTLDGGLDGVADCVWGEAGRDRFRNEWYRSGTAVLQRDLFVDFTGSQDSRYN